MKKQYQTPVFIAEEYIFTQSIAACDIKNVEPFEILKGENYCYNTKNQDNGHHAGTGTIQFPTSGKTTIFNDTAEVDYNNGLGCEYDWPSVNAELTGPDGDSVGSFTKAFYGNESQAGSHTPGYKEQSLFS